MKLKKFPQLLAEMARHGDSQKDLAEKIGIEYHALWRKQIGKTKWTIEEINKVCEIYGKTYEELFK